MNTNKRLQANLYYGIKPKGIYALVSLESNQLRISFDQNSQTKELEWDIDNIQADDKPDDNLFIISYGKGAEKAYLEFKDASNAILELEQVYPTKLWRRTANENKHKVWMLLSISGISILLFCLALYFILIPVLSDQMAKKVPIEWEVDLGNQLSSQFLEKDKEDVLKSAQLDSFFNSMKVQTDYPLKFYYLKDTIVNAFAVPGGSIFVYQGLLEKMNSYEALAGLLGHEFTHIQNKHSLRSLFRSLSGYVLLSILLGDLTGVAGVLLENSHSIQNLSYSRAFEEEADAGAVQILLDRKIALDGMLALFKIFQSMGNKGLQIPEFMRTHPITEQRIKFVEEKISTKEEESYTHDNLNQLFKRIKQNPSIPSAQ